MKMYRLDMRWMRRMLTMRYLLIGLPFFQTFAQHAFCARMAFAAGGANAEIGPQFSHRGHAGIDGLGYFTL
jgi:hypothetical protein